MMTVHSISADGAADYTSYLESKTVAPARGDYYLGPQGEPVESSGRWHASPESLQRLGIPPGQPVSREHLLALMQGTHPVTGERLRKAGANGTRNAGVDVTLSAPKSVSIAWALADPPIREQLEQIHGHAVARTLGFVRDTVPLTTRRHPLTQRNEPALARDLLAAEFRHSTARGLSGRIPDPQLHSHVLITSVIRHDGRIAAVRDRQVYRAARESGAYYRAALAEGLARAGWKLQNGTGKHERYFELEGISQQAIDAFSGRSREIEKAINTYEARHGRRPTEADLHAVKLSTRQAKLPHTEQELRHAWLNTASEHGLSAEHVRVLTRRRHDFADIDPEWGSRVENTLTRERATFSAREMRAAALEQATGRLCPDTALRRADQLVDAGTLIHLQGGAMTTQAIRRLESEILTTAQTMSAHHPGHRPPDRAVDAAINQVHERLGATLSPEQHHAVRLLTSGVRLATLEGQAGTGKGVVVDAVARAERIAGRNIIGIALAGATAQRLGQDAPGLAGHTTTIAALLSGHQRTGQAINASTTIVLDEAGMVDTPTLHALLHTAEECGGKLILVGDGRQLPPIGPGGMFDQLSSQTPKAALTEVRRTTDPSEQRAWRALRRGDAETAMAHYLARGQMHLHDHRRDSLQHAVTRYDQLAREHGLSHVTLISDGPTTEIERMNARAQQLRLGRGELGNRAVRHPDPTVPYALHEGDAIAWRKPQPVPGAARIENGTRATITSIDRRGRLTAVLSGSERHVTVEGEDQLAGLRLGYAHHVVRQQGATVDRAVVLTGGWQTSKENAYVHASRSRHGTEWHVAREDLGTDGTDPERITRLATRMSTSAAKTASLIHPLAEPTFDPDLDPEGPQTAPTINPLPPTPQVTL